MTKKVKIQTNLSQPTFKQSKFQTLAMPVSRASTVVFDTVEQLRQRDWQDKEQYTYGLLGTPTTRRLEQQLAETDGVTHAVLAPSGLAAITLVLMAMLKTGDAVYLPNNVYVPAHEAAKLLAKQYGVIVKLYDPLAIDRLTLVENTKLVWVETPGSVTMEVSDLPKIAEIAHRKGAIVGVDATWAAGIALPVFALGADISMQALTKYQSGGSDVMMGAITTNNTELYQAIHKTSVYLGNGVSPEDCSLILRSLPHLGVRYKAQDKTARAIAQWCDKQPAIDKVLHPALPTAPGHEIWQRDFCGAASLFSLVFKAHIDQASVDKAVESLNLFHLGFSWGGAVSLAVPFLQEQMHATYAEGGVLVRLYIGLEDEADLIHDLESAFALLE